MGYETEIARRVARRVANGRGTFGSVPDLGPIGAVLVVGLVVGFVFSPLGLASAGTPPWVAFGDAAAVRLDGGGNPWAVQLRSDIWSDLGYGGIAFVPREPLTFGGIWALSTDFSVTDDDCGGGSPRFAVAMDRDGDGGFDGNVHIYLGPAPGFTGCAPGWASSGELVGLPPSDLRYDLTQVGGAFYDTYDHALALVGAGLVLYVALIVDSGWMFLDGEQTVLVDNVVVNEHRLTARGFAGGAAGGSSPSGGGPSGCTSIADGGLVDSAGNPLSTGFDAFGYNYQAHLFVGTYDGSDRTLDGTYWGTTGDFVDDTLMMKWSDDWLSNSDCDGDGMLDRGTSGISLGWLTNHVVGDYDADGDGVQETHFTDFVKIVWVGPGGPLWGEYEIILEVWNDPGAGTHGLYLKEGSPGFGLNDGWTMMA